MDEQWNMAATGTASIVIGSLENCQQTSTTNCWAAVLQGVAKGLGKSLSQHRIHQLIGHKHGAQGNTEQMQRILDRELNADMREIETSWPTALL